MSMVRSIARNIARNRLKDAGYERANQRLSMTAQGGRKHARVVERCHKGWKTSRRRQAYIRKIRKLDPALWRRILYGDLAKKAKEISGKAAKKRALANLARKVHRGEAWQRIAAAK